MTEALRTGPGALLEVESTDGTVLAVEQVTQGPHTLLMVPGGPSTRRRWAAVAGLLGEQYSCWLMDRRGRGDSADTPPYAFEREYADLACIVAAIGGTVSLAAHSSGATCALGAALAGVPFVSLVLYEPPWPVDGPVARPEHIDAVVERLAAGDRDGGLRVAFEQVVGLPAPAVEAMQDSPTWAEWRTYAHTWPREMREVDALPSGVGQFAGLATPVLLLCGALTGGHLRRAVTALAAALPCATLSELPGQGHGALGTGPDLVAAAIAAFDNGAALVSGFVSR